MKKIMTVSLMAMMVVGAARADIASVGYVEDKLATKANASDVTSISNKLGNVAEGKTLAGMIADAKQEAIEAAGDATYDDTEIRGLIGDNADAISALETKVGNSSVAEQIDAVRATTIAGLQDEQRQTMFPTVKLTEEMIQTSTNDLATSVRDNALAIAEINDPEDGLLKQAETAAKAYADGLAKNYDTAGSASAAEAAAKSYADGLAKNYDTAGAASAAETAAKAYADGLAGNYDAKGSASAAETAAKAYADSLAGNYDAKGAAATAKSEAITAANSYADGVAATAKTEAIEAAKLAGDEAYDAKGAAEAAQTAAVAAAKSAGDLAYAAKSYEGRVQANETAIAAMAQAGIKAEGTGDGTYALTMKVTDGVRTFQWDQIGY